MPNKILYTLILFGLMAANSVSAQDAVPTNWNSEKIRGTRHLPYPSYMGNPYLNEKFNPGEIEFADGEKIGNILLRYSTFRDEIIYFNSAISVQIIIDKTSLKGFTLTDENGCKRIFKQLYYNGFLPGNRFFEVLSDGEISLLAYRNVILQTCTVYNNESGVPKNMEYVQSFNYYFYSIKDGYRSIRIGKNSFLSKFSESNQKLVKKLLRQTKVRIKDEPSFVKAWELVKANSISMNF